jgi:tRNA(Ile)-lysidine synthase
MFCREAGERLRRPTEPAPLALGESVFDGRFRVDCALVGHRIGFLGGRAARLPADERQRLTHIPAAARGALPAAISPEGAVTCPVLTQSGGIAARPLTLQRLAAALGAIGDEAALWRVAKLTAAP